MRLVPIKEVLAMDEGEKVPSTKGRVETVYDSNEGDNDQGHWTIQNIIVSDPESPKSKLRVKFFNRDPIPKSWRGKLVFISSDQGDKGIIGVQIGTYKGKKCLEVRDRAEVALGDSQRAEPEPEETSPVKPAQPSQQQKAPTQKPPATAEEIHAQKLAHVKKVAVYLNQRTNAYEMVLRAADYVNERRAKLGRPPLSHEHYQALCASLFISLDRSGMTDDMPFGVLDKYLPPQTQNGNKPPTEAKEKK